MSWEFRRLDESPNEGLAQMLTESYGPLLGELPERAGFKLRQGFLDYDREVHHAPDTVGACGFLSLVDGELIGFASWDPRAWPTLGRIGHNCVLPGRQRLGYGVRQMAEILAHFRRRGFAAAEARTGEQAFFEPARRMYLRSGFRLAGHAPVTLQPAYRTLIYSVVLDGAA